MRIWDPKPVDRWRSKTPLDTSLQMVWIILLFSNSMPHPDVFWYCLNKMGTQKNLHPKLFKHFPCQCYAKTKEDKLWILRKQFFSIDANVIPEIHQISSIVGPSVPIMEGKWKGFRCYYTSIHRATLRKRNQKMFRCNKETYLKNYKFL